MSTSTGVTNEVKQQVKLRIIEIAKSTFGLGDPMKQGVTS